MFLPHAIPFFSPTFLLDIGYFFSASAYECVCFLVFVDIIIGLPWVEDVAALCEAYFIIPLCVLIRPLLPINAVVPSIFNMLSVLEHAPS